MLANFQAERNVNFNMLIPTAAEKKAHANQEQPNEGR
jgi:hypothetical protein